MIEQKSIFQTDRERFDDSFIAANLGERAAYEAKIQSESDLTGLDRMHRDRVFSLRQLHSGIVEHGGSVSSANIAESFYKFLQNNGASMGQIFSAAAQLQAADLVARHHAEIVAVSEREISSYEAQYAIFRKANHAVLKRLGLLDKSTAD